MRLNTPTLRFERILKGQVLAGVGVVGPLLCFLRTINQNDTEACHYISKVKPIKWIREWLLKGTAQSRKEVKVRSLGLCLGTEWEVWWAD